MWFDITILRLRNKIYIYYLCIRDILEQLYLKKNIRIISGEVNTVSDKYNNSVFSFCLSYEIKK